MAATRARHREKILLDILETQPLWALDIAEVTGHNLESRGRKEVNRLLQSGWRLLHIYTLTYQDNGVWRERPMAILGKLRGDAEGSSVSPSGSRGVSPALKNQDAFPGLIPIDRGCAADKK